MLKREERTTFVPPSTSAGSFIRLSQLNCGSFIFQIQNPAWNFLHQDFYLISHNFLDQVLIWRLGLGFYLQRRWNMLHVYIDLSSLF